MVTSPYSSPNTKNQKTIAVLPIPTPAPPPTLKVYCRRPQPPAGLANPVGISNSDTGAHSNLGDSLPAPTMSSATVEHLPMIFTLIFVKVLEPLPIELLLILVQVIVVVTFISCPY